MYLPIPFQYISRELTIPCQSKCYNLLMSAGFFGAAIVFPATGDRPKIANQKIVLDNILFSIAFLMAAYILKIV